MNSPACQCKVNESNKIRTPNGVSGTVKLTGQGSACSQMHATPAQFVLAECNRKPGTPNLLAIGSNSPYF